MLTAASLPDFATNYPLAPEPTARSQRNGHVWLRGVAARSEVAAYRPVILAARVRHGQEATPLEQCDTYGRAFLKGLNLWPKDDGVKQFILARRFAKLAAELLGVDGVRVQWRDGVFNTPPSVCFDAQGKLFVSEGNSTRRLTKLLKISLLPES